MSKRNWIGAFALGFIFGWVSFAIIGLIINYTNPPSHNELISHMDQYEQGDQSAQNEPHDFHLSFWKWSGHWIESGDTFAQWIMMVFTVIAAGLLLWTLLVTLKMAKDTREIGEAQVRAYLSFKCDEAGCREPVLDVSDLAAERPNIVVEINGRYVNSGQTPAFNTNLFYDIREISPSKEMRKIDIDDFHDAGVAMHALPPGGESPTTLKRTQGNRA